MVNGDDVICKISEEYKDALVIEYPMSIVKNQVMENEDQIVLLEEGLNHPINQQKDKATELFFLPKLLAPLYSAPLPFFFREKRWQGRMLARKKRQGGIKGVIS